MEQSIINTKTSNALLMKESINSLKGKWGLAVVACLLYLLIIGAINGITLLGPIISMIINGPMSLGLAIFSLSLSRGQEINISKILEGFNNFKTSFVAFALMSLYIFLWSLLLIIPGIIAGISYSQVYYILADDKNISPKDALEKSKQIMEGNKWKFVCLGFRFFGWMILSALTFGIGYIWLFPYMQISYAKFYDDIKR